MTDEKRKALDAIICALGFLEGISYGVELKIAEGIDKAVKIIDKSLKVVLKDEQ